MLSHTFSGQEAGTAMASLASPSDVAVKWKIPVREPEEARTKAKSRLVSDQDDIIAGWGRKLTELSNIV